MTHVATLICSPASPILTDQLLRRAMGALRKPEPPHWLDPAIAADIAFEPVLPTDTRAIADSVRNALESQSIDVIVQDARDRRKKLLLADMDSTMIGQECIDELAAEVGKKSHVAAITERAMRGEIEFEPALRERVALLKGLSSDTILRVVADKISLTSGGPTLVRTMRAHGARTVLVSGGFSVFTSIIAEKIGFDEHRANQLLLDAEGRLSGLVAEPVLGKQAKLAALLQLREKHGLSSEETLAVGDGANDLAMLEAAGLGVAFHAKPKVAAAAHARIDHGDLTALLYAQGYRGEEFAVAPKLSTGEAWFLAGDLNRSFNRDQPVKQQMHSVDLNCDCGEGFGAYRIGDDLAMLDIVTSANVACGFHAGDPEIMAEVFRIAKAKGVAIGAHPGFPDLWGFGRRRLAFSAAEIERLVAYQIGAASGLAAFVGHELGFVKVHGALSNIATEEAVVAQAIAHAVKMVDPHLGLLAPAGTKLETAGRAQGLAVAREIYADRAYTDSGLLVDRSHPGAVLHEADEVAERVLAMVLEGAIITVTGKRLAVGIDSICVHGDSPNAVAMARAVRSRLEGAGIALAPFAHVPAPAPA